MMPRKKTSNDPMPGRGQPVPPGATTQALHEVPMPGEGPPPSDLGDRHAAGTPAGGTEVGGLAGSNEGEGEPDEEEAERAMGTGVEDEEQAEEAEGPFSGHAGGAVGGSPAGLRSAGGHMRHGIAPEGTHRGDSTVGSDP